MGPEPHRIGQQVGAETRLWLKEGGKIDMQGRAAGGRAGLESERGSTETPHRAGDIVA